MKILKKLLPIIGLLYFGWTTFGQTRGVSYDASPGSNTNVIQTVHQKFHSITNLAATASEIAGYDANKKLGSYTAAATRTLLSVPIFDSTDPGAVNIFPFWDDADNEVDWTSNTALRTLLGIDSNDAVTFGPVTGDSFTAGSTNMVGALAGKQPLDADLTALAAIAGAQGAIIYHNGTSWVKLDAGTSGHVLKTQGAGANPQWAAESGGGTDDQTAAEVALTPVGDVAATDVQAAVQELDDEKASKANPEFTGTATFGDGSGPMILNFPQGLVTTNGGNDVKWTNWAPLLNKSNAVFEADVHVGNTNVAGAIAGKSESNHTHTKSTLPAAAFEMVFPLIIEDLADSMNYGIGFVGAAFTISEIRAVHTGSGLSSPSISLTVNQGTDRTSGTAVVTGGSTITSTTTGNSITSFNDATCPANSWLWITTASKSGTTDNLEIIVRGTYD